MRSPIVSDDAFGSPLALIFGLILYPRSLFSPQSLKKGLAEAKKVTYENFK